MPVLKFWMDSARVYQLLVPLSALGTRSFSACMQSLVLCCFLGLMAFICSVAHHSVGLLLDNTTDEKEKMTFVFNKFLGVH